MDRRSGVWAFGAVLYEALTGRRVFAGEDVSDTLANVLKMEPDWERLPAEVTARIRQVGAGGRWGGRWGETAASHHSADGFQFWQVFSRRKRSFWVPNFASLSAAFAKTSIVLRRVFHSIVGGASICFNSSCTNCIGKTQRGGRRS